MNIHIKIIIGKELGNEDKYLISYHLAFCNFIWDQIISLFIIVEIWKHTTTR